MTLPDFVTQTLALGPKFATVGKNSPAELLTLVRDVSRRAPESESDRCVSEGVDVLRLYSPRPDPVPIKRVLSYLTEKTLCLTAADKEGGFFVTPRSNFLEKAQASLDAVFVKRTDVDLKKVKTKAKRMLTDLNLGGLAQSVDKK